MGKAGRNDPCPCGSGKKFKHCHLGREDELLYMQTEETKREVSQKITTLPEVAYGRSREIADAIDFKELTDNTEFKGIKFIDFAEFVTLESFDKGHFKDEHHKSGALIVNPDKTGETDPEHIYIAITPDIHDSSLIHELAHVLDYLGGSGLLPGSTSHLGMETGIPVDHLDHLREFAIWLDYLKDRFQVELDAEDQIVSYLYEHDMLLDASLFIRKDMGQLVSRSREMIRFLMAHKTEIDELIKHRAGYLGKAASTSPPH